MFKDAAVKFMNDKAPRLGAALAYYTIFSLAPLLIIAISIAGLAFGEEAARGEIFGSLRGLVGGQGAAAIQSLVENAARPGRGAIGTAVGLLTLLIGASGVFAQLQDALNTVWNVGPKTGSGLLFFVRQRLITFGMVLVIGFLLLVSLLVSAVLAGLSGWIDRHVPLGATIGRIINFAVSFGVTTLLFAMIYKILPNERIAWRDVGAGAAVTAAMFTVGKFLIGLYLGQSSMASVYGAAGSLVVVLVWVYYSTQILLFGAEFTHVYARSRGSHAHRARAENVITGRDFKRRPA
jgi:membrane protein